MPLTLDPLIGSSVLLGPGFNDWQWDLAWDSSNARRLVVWPRQFSATNTDVRGQFSDGGGMSASNRVRFTLTN